MSGPFTAPHGSLEERVNDCYRALSLIHAACQADPDVVFMEEGDVLDAISFLALDAARVIEPLRHVPFEIGNFDVDRPMKRAKSGKPASVRLLRPDNRPEKGA